jgi:hypothetical protein
VHKWLCELEASDGHQVQSYCSGYQENPNAEISAGSFSVLYLHAHPRGFADVHGHILNPTSSRFFRGPAIPKEFGVDQSVRLDSRLFLFSRCQ